MAKVVVIVESAADARTIVKLAERVILEGIDWLESEQLQYHLVWCGLKEGTEHSCWKDIKDISNDLSTSGYKPPRYLGHDAKNNKYKADGAAAMKVLNLVRYLQKKEAIQAVILVRDLDNQPERREGLKQARLEHLEKKPQLEIIIGAANCKREAWVLNGFEAKNSEEEKLMEETRNKLNFDPCKEAHRLSSSSKEESERWRNSKIVLEYLTKGDFYREQLCWQETSLETLRERGVNTGLTEYLQEIAQRLSIIIDKFTNDLDYNP
jgi:hypothetical protein